MTLDTNFSAIDPSQCVSLLTLLLAFLNSRTRNGNVSIALKGANIPGATGNLTVTPPSSTNSTTRRDILSFVESAFDEFDSFNDTLSQTLPPVSVNQNFPVFDQSIGCAANGNTPAFTAEVTANVTANAQAVITLGLAAAGTIVPPNLSELGVFAGLDASLDGVLELTGDVDVRLNGILVL
jgi:hypothetical protein